MEGIIITFVAFVVVLGAPYTGNQGSSQSETVASTTTATTTPSTSTVSPSAPQLTTPADEIAYTHKFETKNVRTHSCWNINRYFKSGKIELAVGQECTYSDKVETDLTQPVLYPQLAAFNSDLGHYIFVHDSQTTKKPVTEKPQSVLPAPIPPQAPLVQVPNPAGQAQQIGSLASLRKLVPERPEYDSAWDILGIRPQVFVPMLQIPGLGPPVAYDVRQLNEDPSTTPRSRVTRRSTPPTSTHWFCKDHGPGFINHTARYIQMGRSDFPVKCTWS